MTPDQIIETCRSIAEAHYPDDALARAQYQIGLLETKVREMRYGAQPVHFISREFLPLRVTETVPTDPALDLQSTCPLPAPSPLGVTCGLDGPCEACQ